MELKFRLLRADEIDCRVSQIDGNGLALLLYKDARCDMNVLDETVGPMGWSRHHSRDNANCTVSIYDAERGEWVSKEDTGTESNTEAAKGLASDSFKRACVNWGIGRELYTAPFIWVGKDKCEIKEGRNGKPACYDRFAVSRIGYGDNREITFLEIINSKTGNVVYRFGNKEPETPKTWACYDCGEPITAATFPDGKEYTAEQIAKGSYKTYQVTLCGKCYTNRRLNDGNQG